MCDTRPVGRRLLAVTLALALGVTSACQGLADRESVTAGAPEPTPTSRVRAQPTPAPTAGPVPGDWDYRPWRDRPPAALQPFGSPVLNSAGMFTCDNGAIRCLVEVKYRDSVVDVAFFAELLRGDDTVRGAWYHQDAEYMVIVLDDTAYHYCAMPGSAWRDLNAAGSGGPYEHYERYIRGNYDCRNHTVPSFDEGS
jgi:hypothetical protein